MIILDVPQHYTVVGKNKLLWKAGLKKLLVCRQPNDPNENLLTQKKFYCFFRRKIFYLQKLKKNVDVNFMNDQNKKLFPTNRPQSGRN